MIFPCIDLMDGKAVQLVQGREKAIDAGSPDEMLRRFAAFPEIQVIDLDAALGRGSNADAMRRLASQAAIRAGGGVRTVERARELVEQGARKVIVGTAAFAAAGIDTQFLDALERAIGRERIVVALDSRDGRIVVRGWRESTALSAEDVLTALAPYCSGVLCTYVDKEGTMQGTNLEWFRRLRAATELEITAAGGVASIEEVRTLLGIGVNVAVGMAMYSGRLSVAELAALGEA